VRASLSAGERTRLQKLESSEKLSLAPLSKGATEDAFKRRRAMLEAERGTPLSEGELRLLRDTIFGKAGDAFADPELLAELERQAGIESATKEQVGRIIEPIRYAPAPAVMLTQENPEFRQKMTDTIRDRVLANYRTRMDELSSGIAKYNPASVPSGAQERDAYIAQLNRSKEGDIIALQNAWIRATRKVADLMEEPLTQDEAIENVIAEFPILEDVLPGRNEEGVIVEDDPITPANLPRVYKEMGDIAVRIAEEEAKVFRADAEEQIKALKPRRVGEGSARANAGILGFGYDDRMNDPYLSYLAGRS
jgi:hypothetical protein